MMNFKKVSKKLGFSLIEVLIALMIFAITVTSLLSLHSNMSRSIRRGAEKIRIFLEMNNFFYEVQQKKSLETEKLTRQEKKMDDTVLIYVSKPIDENSAFKKIKNLNSQRIQQRVGQGNIKTMLVYIGLEPESVKAT